MIKVLYISYTGFIGGAEISLLTTVKNLNPDKTESLFILPQGPFCEFLEKNRIPFKSVPFCPLPGYYSKFGNKKVFNPFLLFFYFIVLLYNAVIIAINTIVWRPHFIHLNNFEFYLFMPVILKTLFPGKKIVVHIRQAAINQRKIFCFLEWSLKRFTDQIICISEATRILFSNKLQSKITRIYNAFDPSLSPVLLSKEDVRKQEQMECDWNWIFLVSRISPLKGIGKALEAFEPVLKVYPKTKLAIVGDTSLGDENYFLFLKQFIKSKEIGEHVRFFGFRTDVLHLLTAADAVILASIVPEGLARSLIEAMALGIPVLGPRLGGVPEIVIEGKTGFLFEPGNVKEMAEKMVSILSMKEYARTEMSLTSKAFINKNFSIQNHVKEITEVYERLSKSN